MPPQQDKLRRNRHGRQHRNKDKLRPNSKDKLRRNNKDRLRLSKDKHLCNARHQCARLPNSVKHRARKAAVAGDNSNCNHKKAPAGNSRRGF